jgi:NDP-sugar pyrophosphorylase family protein
VPLVGVPLLGESVVSYWMDWLAEQRIREVVLLITDRPEQVRSIVGAGARWGISVEVHAELREPSTTDVVTRFFAGDATAAADRVFVLDHPPGLSEHRLFRSYADWFNVALAWMPRAANHTRVGFREVSPGLWRGRHNQIAPTAQLRPPCWIGENVRVGDHAIIGPGAILENRTIVDSAAEVVNSIVGPDTFVGALTKVHNSIAWGNSLINWRTDSCTVVPDAFLLSPLTQANSFGGTLRSQNRWSCWSSVLGAVWSRPCEILSAMKSKFLAR